MPKHYIYPNPNPDGTDARARLELHWQRDGGVQVATTVVDPAGADNDQPIDVERTIAQRMKEIGILPPAPGDWVGQFVDLTREQINHLIKQLRIARDQAYGRDE